MHLAVSHVSAVFSMIFIGVHYCNVKLNQISDQIKWASSSNSGQIHEEYRKGRGGGNRGVAAHHPDTTLFM